jgi:pyridoxine 5-phosphate synthase
VELHTGKYCEAGAGQARAAELAKLHAAGERVRQLGLVLHAGHGLTYHNVKPVAAIPGMTELNIGHSIVARAIMVGFQQAVREMKELIA